jgi:hypothetical protein
MTIQPGQLEQDMDENSNPLEHVYEIREPGPLLDVWVRIWRGGGYWWWSRSNGSTVSGPLDSAKEAERAERVERLKHV